MLGGADNPNGELPSYITGADISSPYRNAKPAMGWLWLTFGLLMMLGDR